MIKKYIFAILTAHIFLSAIFIPQISFAQELPKPPATINEAKTFALRILTELPGATIRAWQEEVMPILRNIWQWVQQPLKEFWNKVKRNTDIQKEFEKEKEEIKSDLPKTIDTSKSLLERFKELLK